MTKVFIGGSRRASRLNADVRRRIDRIMEQCFDVVVGDANGADRAVQRHLHDAGFRQVEVFCSGDVPRNNIGDWRVRSVDVAPGARRDRAFYTAKDRVMTDEATVGLMIWDGASVGTLSNVLRLLLQGKKVVLHSTEARAFVDFRSLADWRAFAATIDSDVRDKVEGSVHTEGSDDAPRSQAPLFG